MQHDEYDGTSGLNFALAPRRARVLRERTSTPTKKREREGRMMSVRAGSLRVVVAAAATVLLGLASQPATASLIRDTSTSALSQGFGNVPRLLTVQRTGMTTSPEAACNSITGGILAQTCSGADATILPNGKIDTLTGDDGTVSPAGEPAKNNIVDLQSAAINITNASRIRLLDNPSETGSDPTTDIQDITLKFYSTNSGT